MSYDVVCDGSCGEHPEIRPHVNPKFTEYPAILDGIPGVCFLRVPSDAPCDAVLEILARLSAPRARFHV